MRFQKIVHGTDSPLLKSFDAKNPPKLEDMARSAQSGIKVDHPMVVEMRQIQEDLRLTGKEMVELYNSVIPKAQALTYFRFQMIVQGNLRGEASLEQHLAVFRKVKTKLMKSGYGKICGKSLREIIASWVDTLGMDPEKHSIYRELELVTRRAQAEVNYSTINRWANNDQQPRMSYKKLVQIQKYVDTLGKKWKPGLMPARAA